MAKLSPAQMNALTQVHNGETLTARKNTIDSLVRDDYLAMLTSGYVLTDKAYDLGFERPSADEPMADWEREALNGETGKPFAVQQLIGNAWTRVSRCAATWGTANVWRNRMAALGKTVRVHNMVTDEVWV